VILQSKYLLGFNTFWRLFGMKSILELRNEVQNGITKDDVVEAIIYKSKQTKIPKNDSFLQQAFYCLKKETPELFSDFIFDESGVTPFSDELDSVLFRLEASTVLSTLNPNYKNYTIASAPDLLQKSYDKLQSKAAQIDKCAKLFSKLVRQQVKQ
jgi:hypothetical protein